MKQKKLYITIIILLVQSILFAQNISLTDAISIALKNNEKILQYKAKLESKEFENKANWGNFLPSINIQGGYTHLNDKLQIDLNPIRDAIIQLQSNNNTEISNIYNILNGGAPFTDERKYAVYNQSMNTLDSAIPSFIETLKKQNYNTASLIGTQPLFLGGKIIAAKRYSSAEEKAAMFELKKVENEIVAEVAKSYLQNLLLHEIVITRENVLSGITQHMENAKKLFNQGVIANYHLLRAKVAVAEAERNLLSERNNLELAEINFKSLIGFPESEKIIFSDSLKYSELTDSIEYFLNKAKKEQPIIKMIEQKRVSAEQNYNVARSEFLPQIVAFGKYELYPENLSALEPRWAVGVNVKMNLFSGLKDYNKLQSASAIEDEVRFIKEGAEKNVSLWINKSYRDVKNSATELVKLKSTIKLAKENFRQNSKRFNNGLGTSLEVIDSRLTLEKIEIDMQVSLYNYYSAIAELENAAGNSLELLNTWNK